MTAYTTFGRFHKRTYIDNAQSQHKPGNYRSTEYTCSMHLIITTHNRTTIHDLDRWFSRPLSRPLQPPTSAARRLTLAFGRELRLAFGRELRLAFGGELWLAFGGELWLPL